MSFLDLVQGRSSHVFLDFRFLLHASVPHRRPSELRKKVFHSHRSPSLRFLSLKGHSFRKAASRRNIHLRLISWRCSLQYGYNEARRILPEDPLRYRALCKWTQSKAQSLQLNSMLLEQCSNDSNLSVKGRSFLEKETLWNSPRNATYAFLGHSNF